MHRCYDAESRPAWLQVSSLPSCSPCSCPCSATANLHRRPTLPTSFLSVRIQCKLASFDHHRQSSSPVPLPSPLDLIPLEMAGIPASLRFGAAQTAKPGGAARPPSAGGSSGSKHKATVTQQQQVSPPSCSLCRWELYPSARQNTP